MQLVESVPLLTNSKANGFVGVNLYCDDTGSIKQLPINVRATDMARCCGHAIEVRPAAERWCLRTFRQPGAARPVRPRRSHTAVWPLSPFAA